MDYGIFSLKGKVIVVTGGVRKYGRHFCEALAEAGGTVVLTSRDRTSAEKTAAELRAAGGDAHGLPLDQADDASIDKLVESVIKGHGKIDVLVNNARHIPREDAPQITRKELDLTFSVNCTGLILLTRRVSEEMKRKRSGNIINIGSIYGMAGQDLSIYEKPEENVSLDYPIQKGGTIAYTKQMATTLAAYGIRCNCLSLGGLGSTASNPYFLERYCKKVPLGRMAVGNDVKGPIVFLASDASAYMTGANLVVDGGWTAW